MNTKVILEQLRCDGVRRLRSVGKGFRFDERAEKTNGEHFEWQEIAKHTLHFPPTVETSFFCLVCQYSRMKTLVKSGIHLIDYYEELYQHLFEKAAE